MEKTLDVVALGELLIDFSPVSINEKGYPTLKANPGGAPCNLLSALSMYGCKTAFIGKVGEDTFGRLLIKTLKEKGIETCGLVIDPNVFTTLAFVSLDENGERDFSFARKPGADMSLKEEEIDFELIEKSKVFHFGTLSLTDEPSRSATKAAVSFAKEHGCLISCDPNLRKPLWNDLEEARKQILWSLMQADVVKLSDEEVAFLFDREIENAVEIILNEYGVRLVFITLGAKGCYYATKRLSGVVSCPQVNCIDTTGAGDIFGGSMLSRLIGSGKEIERLSGEEIDEIVRFSVAAASLSTEKTGGMESVPKETDVLKKIKDSNF